MKIVAEKKQGEKRTETRGEKGTETHYCEGVLQEKRRSVNL